MSPLLRAAEDGQPHRVREVADQIAISLSLPEHLRQESLPDGRNKLIHRLEWARTYLKKAGLLEYPDRGLFKITDRGTAALKRGTDGINNRFLQQFPEFREFKAKKVDHPSVGASETQDLDPEEALDHVFQALRAAVEDDLLSRLKAALPDFFERLVVDLLLKMGMEDLGKRQAVPSENPATRELTG